MSFNGFLFVTPMAILLSERKVLANFVESHPRNICEIILKLGHWPTSGCHLKIFVILALVPILFSVAERF